MHPRFAEEFLTLSEEVQDGLMTEVLLLEEIGPALSRPHVDTLNNSKYANMKEIRFKADGGVWRTAFAFDPDRQAIILVAGNKSGVSEKRFYKQLIKTADERFADHLKTLKGE